MEIQSLKTLLSIQTKKINDLESYKDDSTCQNCEFNQLQYEKEINKFKNQLRDLMKKEERENGNKKEEKMTKAKPQTWYFGYLNKIK